MQLVNQEFTPHQILRVRLWQSWLRDPTHKQIKGALILCDGKPDDSEGELEDSRIVGHCCLGGACEVHRVATDGKQWWQTASVEGDGTVRGRYASSSTELGPKVRAWYGLEENPWLPIPVHVLQLLILHPEYGAKVGSSSERWSYQQLWVEAVRLNDVYEVPFPLIADCLELRLQLGKRWALYDN